MEEPLFNTHIDMWKHYDDLRQSKSTGFLTANSILVGITGFLFKDAKAAVLLVGIAALGIVVCGAWFLLLLRNAAYIEYHREQAGGGNKEFWAPKTRLPRSSKLDRAPCIAFFFFWVTVAMFLLRIL